MESLHVSVRPSQKNENTIQLLNTNTKHAVTLHGAWWVTEFARLTPFFHSFCRRFSSFSVIYDVSGGKNELNQDFIYPVLDWNNGNATHAIAVVMASVVSVLLLHLVLSGINQLKLVLSKRCSSVQPIENEPDTEASKLIEESESEVDPVEWKKTRLKWAFQSYRTAKIDKTINIWISLIESYDISNYWHITLSKCLSCCEFSKAWTFLYFINNFLSIMV